jgi:biotin/methionine sulfoxide reductase
MLHPDDAAARSVRDGDVVELFNDRGRILASAHVTDGVARGVVRMATGAWTDPAVDPPDAHGNPNLLTSDRPASRFSQGCAALSCLVQLAACPDPRPVTAHEAPAHVPA